MGLEKAIPPDKVTLEARGKSDDQLINDIETLKELYAELEIACAAEETETEREVLKIHLAEIGYQYEVLLNEKGRRPQFKN